MSQRWLWKNIRHLKLLGSNKIDGHCPARLNVTVNKEDNRVKVKFTKTHVGHNLDVGRLTLSKFERGDIAAKIKNKIPFDEILNEIRDNITKDQLERIHLLTRKDLFNIETLYNLHSEAC